MCCYMHLDYYNNYCRKEKIQDWRKLCKDNLILVLKERLTNDKELKWTMLFIWSLFRFINSFCLSTESRSNGWIQGGQETRDYVYFADHQMLSLSLLTSTCHSFHLHKVKFIVGTYEKTRRIQTTLHIE